MPSWPSAMARRKLLPKRIDKQRAQAVLLLFEAELGVGMFSRRFVRAEQSIPKGEERPVIRIGPIANRRMMNTMRSGRNEDDARDSVCPFRECEVGVLRQSA